jgi:hypothetical protein
MGLNMQIEIYTESEKEIWDEFVRKSKNGTFLFCRDYMDYHSDRFEDYSLLIRDAKDKLIAILPANRHGEKLVSHGGLTYGGFITDETMKTPIMLDVFEYTLAYFKEHSFNEFVYKTIPHIYHRIPAEEDLYALFVHRAKLVRREVSSTVISENKVNFAKLRKRSIGKAKKNGVKVKICGDFKTYMAIEEYVLKKYHQLKPVHTTAEIEMLANRFPNNIKLFASYLENQMLAGVIVYESANVSHAQYIVSTDEGKEIGGTDIIFDYLINDYYGNKKYFDFGISTEDEGRYLNKGLIANKEGFGARAVVYDTYELKVK